MAIVKYTVLVITLITACTSSAIVTDITTREQFDALKQQADKSIIIDFYTDWCSYCTMIKTPFEELSNVADYTSIIFARVNIDQLPDVAKEHDIKSLPTIILFKNGTAADKIIGAKNETAFKETLQTSIANQYKIVGTKSLQADAPTTQQLPTSACPFCQKAWGYIKVGLIFILDGLSKIITYLRSLLS
jgi:thioredoxin 1